MIVTLCTERIRTVDDIRAFLGGSEGADIAPHDREAAYAFIERTLVRFRYHFGLSRAGKGPVRKYVAKVTGYSDAQLTRLIRQQRRTVDRFGLFQQPRDLRFVAGAPPAPSGRSSSRCVCSRSPEPSSRPPIPSPIPPDPSPALGKPRRRISPGNRRDAAAGTPHSVRWPPRKVARRQHPKRDVPSSADRTASCAARLPRTARSECTQIQRVDQITHMVRQIAPSGTTLPEDPAGATVSGPAGTVRNVVPIDPPPQAANLSTMPSIPRKLAAAVFLRRRLLL